MYFILFNLQISLLIKIKFFLQETNETLKAGVAPKVLVYSYIHNVITVILLNSFKLSG